MMFAINCQYPSRSCESSWEK